MFFFCAVLFLAVVHFLSFSIHRQLRLYIYKLVGLEFCKRKQTKYSVNSIEKIESKTTHIVFSLCFLLSVRFQSYFETVLTSFITLLKKRTDSKKHNTKKHRVSRFCCYFLKKGIKKVRCLFSYQGHPTTIFGKYLFGRRFEIQNFRKICCKIYCLPTSPRIFEHLKHGIIAHF